MGQKGTLIYGVGINDADYPVYQTVDVGGKRKVIWTCPFYHVWIRMLERCYSERFLKRNPNYEGCTVSGDWLRLSNFRSWMEQQYFDGNELDKDLLVKGNKVYGPENCVFISASLNTFMTEVKLNNSDLPIGVWMNGKKFSAKCNNPISNKRDYLGSFQSPNDAYLAWKKRKNEIAIELSTKQTDIRVINALKSRYA